MGKLSYRDKEIILSSIRTIPNFPKVGIEFKDITTLLTNPTAFNLLMSHLYHRYATLEIDYITGLDTRGFTFAAMLADRLEVGFFPIRKKDKSITATATEKYSPECSFQNEHMHIDSFGEIRGAKILFIDDLIGTGIAAESALKLIHQVGAECIEACFVMELLSLEGRKKLNTTVYSVLELK